MISLKELKGVGEQRYKAFASRGIETAEDLIRFFPRSHEDMTKFTEIADAAAGETVCIRAEIFSPVKEIRIKKNFTLYTMVIYDESGMMAVKWYNNRYVKGVFSTGEKFLFCGKVAFVRGKKELENPIYEKADKQRYIGRIVPVYPLSGNLTQKIIRSVTEEALERVGNVREYIPRGILEKYSLDDINFCLRNIHFPENAESFERARKRFVFEELFFLQLALYSKKATSKRNERPPFKNTECVKDFINSLPFKLTEAQLRVIDEICRDFSGNIPMNRLLQGDVGSGKTAVAAAGMYVAYKNGCQSAIMAPTEILAKQHYDTFVKFFEPFGIKIVLLTSSARNKKALYEEIESGGYDIVIGTSAIIQKDVKYKNLGLVISDEQHRFGVSQRAMLTAKGENPNTLVMTATPIPRTLSLILYGDLDISVIDEMPPGRIPVATYAVGENMRQRIYAFLDKHIKNGSQAYIVCSLIEDTQQSDLANVTDLYSKIKDIFPRYKIGLMHGKLKPDEKETVMNAFNRNEIQILVSTTVIEVGMNVPNSNIMIIENAERFGLSTLHQLRGRVGRGAEQAYCIMFVHSQSEITKKRMQTLCTSNDGFYISEQDLKLRGPGDFFGTRQHGLPEMKIANLFSDAAILQKAQEAAKDILDGKFVLTDDENIILSQKTEKILSESVVLN